MSEGQTGVFESPPPPNLGEPFIENHAAELLYAFGTITRAKSTSTLPSRFQRAKLFREALKVRETTKPGKIATDPTDPIREEHMKKFDKFQRVEHEFDRQRAIELKDPEWGSVTVCYAELNQNAGPENPIVLISGASNGVESMDTFVREAAVKNPDRRIYVLGYPEAPSGKISEEYHQKVVAAKDLTIHNKVFKMMSQHLVPEKDFEMWGYSTGATIVTNLSTDSDFAKYITNVVLICPYGAVEQTPEQFDKGVRQDSFNTLAWLKKLPQYVWINGSKNDPEQPLKLAVWKSIQEKGAQNIVGTNLPNIHLRDGAKILIISGGKDKLTNSASIFNMATEANWKQKNPNVLCDVVPNAIHTGPFLQPERFVKQISEKLNRPVQPA